MQLKFGITPPSNLWQKTLSEKQAILNDISTAGFDHIYLADHVSFRDGSGTDGFVGVAGLSQLHDTLGVMISIYLLPLRHPLPVARQLATMHQLAPGRMLFGIGVGGEDRHEIEICGIDPRTRGKRTNESLRIIKDLLDGQEVTVATDHFKLESAKIKPAVSPSIPIIIGGRSDAALNRAAHYGDGWIGVWCSPERFAQAVDLIQQTALTCDRGETQWLHGYQPWIGVDTDPQRARLHVKTQMEAFYKIPFEKFERYTPFGTPTQVADALAAYAHAGCRLFNLKVCAASPEEEINWAAEITAELGKRT